MRTALARNALTPQPLVVPQAFVAPHTFLVVATLLEDPDAAFRQTPGMAWADAVVQSTINTETLLAAVLRAQASGPPTDPPSGPPPREARPCSKPRRPRQRADRAPVAAAAATTPATAATHIHQGVPVRAMAVEDLPFVDGRCAGEGRGTFCLVSESKASDHA